MIILAAIEIIYLIISKYLLHIKRNKESIYINYIIIENAAVEYAPTLTITSSAR